MKVDLHLENAYSVVHAGTRTVYLFGNGALVIKDDATNKIEVKYGTGDTVIFTVKEEDYQVSRILTHDGVEYIH